MALPADSLNLADIVRRDPKNGDSFAYIVEKMNNTNEILSDVPWLECNDGTGHHSLVRTGLPTVTWRQLYKGVQPSKSSIVPVRDTTGMLEGRSLIDAKLAKFSKNIPRLRMQEAQPFIEALSQEAATTLFYGNTANVADMQKFMGLTPRFNALSGSDTSENVFSALGANASKETSIWLIAFSENTVHGIYPDGSMGGLKRDDKGIVRVTDSDGNPFDAYEEVFQWDCGLSVRDWRAVSRICNIDTEKINPGHASYDVNYVKTLHNLIIRASEKIRAKVPSLKINIYCNTLVRTALRIGNLEKSSYQTTYDTTLGKMVSHFDDMQVKRCDAILNTEAVVS